MIDTPGAPLGAVSRETHATLETYVSMLLAENERQNLVSRGTVDDIWQRHIIDSAQLAALIPDPQDRSWADLGSGAGLPGVILSILTKAPTTLIEPRRLRVEFLKRVAAELRLLNVSVIPARAQSARGEFDVITARAVAKAGEILGISRHLAHKDTTYLLMKGRTAQSELDALQQSWQGKFELVPSITDPDAGIIVASNVSPRGGK